MSIVLDAILRTAINPALGMLPVKMDSDAARVELLAIGLQESRLKFRAQKTSDPYRKGPARGLWQFERGGGVVGVMTHPATKELASQVCKTMAVPFEAGQIHAMLEFRDVLAAAFARLLLWTDPKALPEIGDESGALACYLRNWRPGRPHPETWPDFYQQSVSTIYAIPRPRGQESL